MTRATTCPKPSSAGNTAPNGNREKNPTTPVNDAKNSARCQQYKALAAQESKVVFGGRLGEYRYYDMDAVIGEALEKVKREE